MAVEIAAIYVEYVQFMTRHQTSDEPLPEPMRTVSPTKYFVFHCTDFK